MASETPIMDAVEQSDAPNNDVSQNVIDGDEQIIEEADEQHSEHKIGKLMDGHLGEINKLQNVIAMLREQLEEEVRRKSPPACYLPTSETRSTM